MGKIQKSAFTIVELLVVIVVIGILAAITIVSYSGISNKSIAAGLQSDLNNASKILKMYNVDHGSYPSGLNSSNCPYDSLKSVDANYCLKASNGNAFRYSTTGNPNNPTGFNLSEINLSSQATYTISDNSTPKKLFKFNLCVDYSDYSFRNFTDRSSNNK